MKYRKVFDLFYALELIILKRTFCEAKFDVNACALRVFRPAVFLRNLRAVTTQN